VNLSVQEWQALFIGASLALAVMAGLQWAAQSVHQGLEMRRRIRLARERSERALRVGSSNLPDGNHGENVTTARTGGTGDAGSMDPAAVC